MKWLFTRKWIRRCLWASDDRYIYKNSMLTVRGGLFVPPNPFRASRGCGTHHDGQPTMTSCHGSLNVFGSRCWQLAVHSQWNTGSWRGSVSVWRHDFRSTSLLAHPWSNGCSPRPTDSSNTKDGRRRICEFLRRLE